MQLIFIHGSGGSGQVWDFQIRHFKNSHALDLPGHPKGKQISSIEGYAQWLNQYIEENQYTDVVLAGHSMGGAVALMYALMYPSDLKGIITIGSGARLRVHPMFLDTLGKMTENPETFNAFINPAHEKIEPGLAQRITLDAITNGPKVMLNDLIACDRFDISDRLDRINVPTLALCGDLDIMTPPKFTEFLSQKIPGAISKIIPGGTHMVFAEAHQEINRAIEKFLTETLNFTL